MDRLAILNRLAIVFEAARQGSEFRRAARARRAILALGGIA